MAGNTVTSTVTSIELPRLHAGHAALSRWRPEAELYLTAAEQGDALWPGLLRADRDGQAAAASRRQLGDGAAHLKLLPEVEERRGQREGGYRRAHDGWRMGTEAVRLHACMHGLVHRHSPVHKHGSLEHLECRLTHEQDFLKQEYHRACWIGHACEWMCGQQGTVVPLLTLGLHSPALPCPALPPCGLRDIHCGCPCAG